ncbi:MAG: hypothetical protein IJO26_00905 [Clostridium sp.]|nr:hypothetical protein [Clostridium sp.]
MNNKTKKLLKENNKFEKNLSKESNKILTDIVVYLRGSTISEYHQEEVRRDISQMIFDGEKRNESVYDIIGEDYKSFCDEIVKSFPPRSKKEKILELFSTILLGCSILSLIWLFSSTFTSIIGINSTISIYKLPVTLGQIISGTFIIFCSISIFKYICNTTFNESSNIKSFFIACLISTLITGISVLIIYFLKTILFYIPYYIGLILIIIFFILSKILENLE